MYPGAVAGLIVPSLHGRFQGGYAIMCPAHAVHLFLRQPSRLQDSRAVVGTGDLLAGTRHATVLLPCASQILCPSQVLLQFVQHASATAQIICLQVVCRIEVILQGCASSARLAATFACAEASAVTEAIIAGTLSCMLISTLLCQCGKSLTADSASTAGLHFSEHQLPAQGCSTADA